MGFLTIKNKVQATDGSTESKKDECNANVDHPMIEKTFIDLNADCLMEIFTYLTLKDLVNVAETYSQFKDEHFNNCLKDIFLKKRGHDISFFSDPRFLGPEMYQMKLFGNLITSLSLVLLESHYFDKEIENYICKYSRESLNKIYIHKIHKYTMYGRKEPFPKVHSLILNEGQLGKDFCRFKILFPKLEKLELENLEIEDPECIEEHFPLLKHISVHNTKEIKYENFDWYNENKRIFTNSNLRIFFKLNPQIEILSLNHDVDDIAGRFITGEHGIKLSKEFLCSVQRKLPQLQNLELKIMQPGLWNGNRGVDVNFPMLHTLQINVHDWNMLYHLPIACKNLYALHLICKDDAHIDYEAIAKVVRNNANIAVLRLFGEADAVFDMRNVFMLALGSQSSNLRELEILYPTCDSVLLHDFTEFMARCNSLTKLTVYYSGREEVDHLQFEQTFRNNAAGNELLGQWKLEFSTKMSIVSSFSSIHVANYVIIEKEI